MLATMTEMNATAAGAALSNEVILFALATLLLSVFLLYTIIRLAVQKGMEKAIYNSRTAIQWAVRDALNERSDTNVSD